MSTLKNPWECTTIEDYQELCKQLLAELNRLNEGGYDQDALSIANYAEDVLYPDTVPPR